MAESNQPNEPSQTFAPSEMGADHLYIVTMESGINLMEVHFGDAKPQLDADLGSALIMAVWQLSQEVAKSEVRQVQLKEGHLVYYPSKYVVFVLHVRPVADVKLCQSFLKFLAAEFDTMYYNLFLRGWDGNVIHFTDFRNVIEKMTAKEVKHRQRDENAAMRAFLWKNR
jgi:hypothetical protein